ncbi:MAG: class I SAM-dependent methyltransferase [Alphaproteobacteria bacterium]
MDISYRIKNLIRKESNISIARFMEEVISNDQYGYYNNNDTIGELGDFITSPEISQLFGEMIGLWCADVWYKLNCPKEFILVELGPGKGTLIDDLLRSTKNIPGFHNAIQIHLVEISANLRERQEEILSKYNIPKYWHKSIKNLPDNLPSIYIANEFFDALPINQYIKLKDDWFEITISLNEIDEELCFVYMPVMDKVKTDLENDYDHLTHNSIVEISSKSIEIIKTIGDNIVKNNGAALIIDYGYTDPYSERKATSSTLQAIKNHKFHPILKDIGKADISAHVDFYTLAEAVKVKSINPQITTQGKFLTDIGINIRANLLLEKADIINKKNIYLALDRLTSPNKMGNLFKVLSMFYNKNANQIIL